MALVFSWDLKKGRAIDRSHRVGGWYSLHRSWRLVIVSASIVFLAAILIVHEFSPRSMCGSRGNYVSISPDGAYRAVLYEFDCGATTDFGTDLAVDKNRGKFDPFESDGDRLVLTANGDHQRAPVDGNGILHVDVRWQDSTHLLVAVPANARVFKKETASGPISIGYETR